MFSLAKRYTSEGRDRYGSAIFIDDLSENIIDSVIGRQRNQTIIIALVVLIFSKLISANFLGLVFTLPLYCIIYFLTEKDKKLTFTRHRILITTSYRNLRFVLTVGYILVISSLVIAVRTIFPQVLDSGSTRIIRMVNSLHQLGIPDILLFQYQQFYLQFPLLFNYLDALITISTNLWFGIQYLTYTYQFSEINLSHIGEELITKGNRVGLLDFSIVITLFLFVELFLIDSFSLIFLILLALFYYYIPKWKITKLTLFGPTSRSLMGEMILLGNQSGQLSRVTATIFGWDAPTEDLLAQFPDNIIPSEVVSTYQTGMGASLKNALLQANQLGAFLSTLINIAVIIALTRFALIFVPSALDTVFILGTSLVFVSLAFGAIIHYMNKIRLRFQNKEKLMIGPGFIARFFSPSLWIVKGSKMEGTKLRRGVSQPYFKFDRSRGLIIQWQKLTFFLILIVFVTIIAIWSSLGAIEISNLILLFPILIDFGFQFLVEKANLELGFFIISGYGLWFITQFLYPQLYARSRPSLLIELEYSTLSPIILKDFEEHQDASKEFSKAVIKTSRPNRRGTTGRPGEFFIGLTITNITIKKWEKIVFFFGENAIKREINYPIQLPYEFEGYLRESALTGYPIITGKINVEFDENVIATKYFTAELLYKREDDIIISLNNEEKIALQIRIIDQKS